MSNVKLQSLWSRLSDEHRAKLAARLGREDAPVNYTDSIRQLQSKETWTRLEFGAVIDIIHTLNQGVEVSEWIEYHEIDSLFSPYRFNSLIQDN